MFFYDLNNRKVLEKKAETVSGNKPTLHPPASPTGFSERAT